MYPPGHPSLRPAAENVLDRLDILFRDRKSLSIGIAHDQLVIEGVATDSKHPVLSDLAKRLHEHQLGALTFERRPDLFEIEELLKTLAADADVEGQPLGLRGDRIPQWDHVQLFGLGYERLRLADGERQSVQTHRASELWLGLARSAMAGEGEFDPAMANHPERIAESIRRHRREAAYDQVIVGYLLQLADELKQGKGQESVVVREQVSTLIQELDDPTLQRLVEMGGDFYQRKQFVLDASQGLAVEAVMKVLRAAANASEQTISNSMTRLLTKLAMHAESGPARVPYQADEALRENVEELIEDWELKDPNPDAYTLILDQMARAAPVFAPEDGAVEEELSGAARLIEMSVEIGAWGPTVHKAVADLVDQGQTPWLIHLIETAPAENPAVERLRQHLASPAQLRRVLAGEDVDEDALRRIVERMGEAAIDPLLDVLAESPSRAIRRKVFDVVARMDSDAVAARVAERMEDTRWFVLRNMLALIQRLGIRPPEFTAGPFLQHPDARVRREALPVALRESSLRERALAAALADEDERMVRMALLELRGQLPETLTPILVNRVVLNDNRPDDLRALAVRVLEPSRSTLALDALVRLLEGGRTLFGRRRLAPKSVERLAALRVLAQRWDGHPKARPLLAEARRSKDPDVREAARETPA